MNNQKPIIPNNSIFQNHKILHCVNNEDYIEVYAVEDLRFLYLIKGMVEIVSKKYDTHPIKLNGKNYYYFVTTEFIEDLSQLWSNLTQVKGFLAVAGMDQVKQKLYESVIYPIENPEKCSRFKVSIPNGILLYGPTGCGKTFIIEKLAEEINYNFLKVDHSELASPYIHESVLKISQLFDKAKRMSPCILFLDEIEALMPDRAASGENAQYKRDETNEFLIRLNNAGNDHILVIGATNNMDLMDSAILRSGRFDEKIYVSAPDKTARAALFKFSLRGRPVDNEVDYAELADLTENYSCSDIVHIVEESSRFAMLHDNEYLTTEILKTVIQDTQSSLLSEKSHNSIGFL